ncbi:LPXTG cell wall anchor domain-containing protein [Streptomyces sp. CBMA152]|uniref:LPXTG cell wall anchor domain-containing protein n=1 Tax=Streptomyces sp. CBMA152 TaxID=1896312 RepID=UPI0016610B8D|nr:LPXTG cell wall anchor domain-containing protein [Streptomyces sp. CBMA152]MBD0746581.1 peptidase [Streptomyces sp. CBMA152]
MKIRRVLATAVAAAVTAPVLILSAGTALADAQPAAQTQAQKKPTIEELEKAAAEAKKAYDDALAAQDVAQKAVDAAMSDDAPLNKKAKDADKEAGAATAAKTVADKAVTDAADALAALPADAKTEDRTAAQKVLDDAKKDAEKAAATKKAADAKAAAALKEAQDAQVAALRALHTATEATKKALTAKDAADQALADAKKAAENPSCEPDAKLTTVVTGLPSKIAAGTTANFSLRVTNGTGKNIDKLWPFTYLHATDKSGYKVTDDLLHLQWSTAASGGWKDLDSLHRAGVINGLKDGTHYDMKLRLKIDAKAPAGQGIAFVAGDYVNKDKSCGGTPDLTEYSFEILPVGTKPGDVDPAKPTTGKPNTSDTKTQTSTTSTTPLNTTNTGTLAATGTSSATSQLALAGGAAVVVGAGAVYAARRRRSGTN